MDQILDMSLNVEQHTVDCRSDLIVNLQFVTIYISGQNQGVTLFVILRVNVKRTNIYMHLLC